MGVILLLLGVLIFSTLPTAAVVIVCIFSECTWLTKMINLEGNKFCKLHEGCWSLCNIIRT